VLLNWEEIMWWYVMMPYATYALEIHDGFIVKTPPIARWMLKRDIGFIGRWIKWKGGNYKVFGG
jgi:hypothetical protein